MKQSDAKPHQQEKAHANIANRRELLVGAALAGLAAPLAGSALAADGHEHHAHHGPHHPELTKLALDCVGLGEACVAHCIKLMGTGDTSLTDCLIAVNAMLPMCATLARYAASDAKRLNELAAVCIDVCDDCAKECEKHPEHAECKACGDACVDCIKACKDLIAA
ncbi:MAG: Csp1 family four helix bundle copper storage protein [Methyloceanibacter sp.]|nr:Csp1 family four helix bundle copper storage protein [Methyloceanibacter sp.]